MVPSTFVSLQGDNFYVYSRYHNLSTRPACRVAGDILDFSASAKSRVRRYLRCCQSDYTVLLTLTWPASSAPSPSESYRCLKVLSQRLVRRFECSQRLFSMLWVREFTSAGTAHYHCISTHYIPKFWVGRVWAEICQTGHDSHEKAGTRVEKIRSGRAGIARYFSKYLSEKTGSKAVQHVAPSRERRFDGRRLSPGRWWGVFGFRGTLSASIRHNPDGVGREISGLALAAAEKRLAADVRDGLAKEVRLEYCTVYSYAGSKEVSEAADWFLGLVQDLCGALLRFWRKNFFVNMLRHTRGYYLDWVCKRQIPEDVHAGVLPYSFCAG